jgi:hypothetical protein
MQGGASILILLLMLTLLSFGLLALLSAQADALLSGKNADRVLGYYALDARAQNALGALDGALAESARIPGGASPGQRAAALGWRAEPAEPSMVSQTFSGEKAALAVTLRLRPDAPPDTPRFEILCWREIPQAFDYNVGQELWVPDTLP